MLDTLFQAFRNSGGLTIRPGVVRLSDHLQICSGKLKTRSFKKPYLLNKISIFPLALVLHLSHFANRALREICPHPKARAGNSKLQIRGSRFQCMNPKYVGTINKRIAARCCVCRYSDGSTESDNCPAGGTDKSARSDGDLFRLVRNASFPPSANS